MADQISFVKSDTKAPGYKDCVFRIDNHAFTRRYLPYKAVASALPDGTIKTIADKDLSSVPWDDSAAATEWAAAVKVIEANNKK